MTEEYNESFYDKALKIAGTVLMCSVSVAIFVMIELALFPDRRWMP